MSCCCFVSCRLSILSVTLFPFLLTAHRDCSYIPVLVCACFHKSRYNGLLFSGDLMRPELLSSQCICIVCSVLHCQMCGMKTLQCVWLVRTIWFKLPFTVCPRTTVAEPRSLMTGTWISTSTAPSTTPAERAVECPSPAASVTLQWVICLPLSPCLSWCHCSFSISLNKSLY